MCSLLAKHGAPSDAGLTLLSVDTDLLDYWILSEILECGYAPRLLVVEFSAALGPKVAWAVPRSLPLSMWDRTDYFGASLMAYSKLAARFGYALLYVESAGVNAFFAHHSLLAADARPLLQGQAAASSSHLFRAWIASRWRPPAYPVYRVVSPNPTEMPKSLLNRNVQLPSRRFPGRCSRHYNKYGLPANLRCFGHHTDGFSRPMVEV